MLTLRREGILGMLAGLCIALGGSAFLACESRYVGAVLFCVALLTICYFGFSLYTGKIGFVVQNHCLADIGALVCGLLGNLVACALFGLMIRYGLPHLAQTAENICAAKLQQEWYQTLIRGTMCGVLMYIAVWVFRNKASIVGILFCIPVFILSGFEHSIADAFYMAVAGMFNAEVVLFIGIVVLGNTLGAVLIPLLQKGLGKEKTA